MDENIILEINNLTAEYREPRKNPFSKGILEKKVLKGISFQLKGGEILGLVGESGCGKSTLAKTILGFVKPSGGLLECREKQVQMIFQDPYSSLNPSKTVGWILEEPLKMQKKYTKIERKQKVEELLGRVGLEKEFSHRYPRELSGGQRQRVSIAIALIQEAKLIIADEPVSALDVTISKQIMELMLELQQQMGLTYLFISHDLNVIYQMCDRVMVMEQGKIVEIGDVEELFTNPKHEYTKKLLEATV